MSATLPQLLDQFRTRAAADPDFAIRDQIEYTYQSLALEDSTLTLPDVQALLQTDARPPDKPLPDSLRVIDHHQALAQVLNLASQHEPINRAVLQSWASTLNRQTGDTIHTLLGSYDTRRGELRADSGQVSGRKLIDAQKLPVALDTLMKRLNSALPSPKIPRQVYGTSFTVQFKLLTLHPFGVGNGPDCAAADELRSAVPPAAAEPGLCRQPDDVSGRAGPKLAGSIGRRADPVHARTIGPVFTGQNWRIVDLSI